MMKTIITMQPMSLFPRTMWNFIIDFLKRGYFAKLYAYVFPSKATSVSKPMLELEHNENVEKYRSQIRSLEVQRQQIRFGPQQYHTFHFFSLHFLVPFVFGVFERLCAIECKTNQNHLSAEVILFSQWVQGW